MKMPKHNRLRFLRVLRLVHYHSIPLDLLLNKPDGLEIVLTGRRAHPELIAMAHLVTEMKPIKHYFDIGVMARQGIEY